MPFNDVFDWDEFLALGEELAARPNDEAASRSAISRAYYATFYAGRGYLVQRGVPVQQGRYADVRVQDDLRKRDEKRADEILRHHGWRKQSDYEDPCAFEVAVQAVIAVNLARRTSALIRTLL